MKPISLKLKGRIKTGVIQDGVTIMESAWQNNLILDRGLDKIAEVVMCDVWRVAGKGIGFPVSATNTYTQATNTVTRSTGTRDFTSADIGRSIQLTGGPVQIITATPSATTATVADSQTVGVAVAAEIFIPTTETVQVANTYTQVGTTVTRAAGTRVFNTHDVGKLIKFIAADKYARIESITSASVVEVDVTNTGVTTNNIVLYTVLQDWDSVVEQGTEYSAAITATKPLGDAEVVASSAIFSAGDVGKGIYFNTSKRAFEITAFTDSTHVDVDNSADEDIAVGETFAIYDLLTDDGELLPTSRTSSYSTVSGSNSTTTVDEVRTFKRTFIFPEEPEVKETPTGNYSQATTTVTRTTGSHTFSVDDVGKIIRFSDGSEVTITAIVDADNATVDTSQTVAATTVDIYGFVTYSEVFFSDEEFPGDNINIRVVLDNPVDVYGPTGDRPAQQLKLIYEQSVTVSPATSEPQDLSTIITDSGNQMGANKNGDKVIEGFATSTVDTTGSTNISFAYLEPSIPGELGFGTSSAALVPLNGPNRSAGVHSVDMTADDYNPGSFTRTYEGTFGLNQANGTTFRSLMLYDSDAAQGVFTFLFDTNKTKDGNHVLTIQFTKTWGRDLS